MNEEVQVTLNDRPALDAETVLLAGGRPSRCRVTLPPGQAPQLGDALRIELRDGRSRRVLNQFTCTRTLVTGDGRRVIHGLDRRRDWQGRHARLDLTRPDKQGVTLRAAFRKLLVAAGLPAEDAPLPETPAPAQLLDGSLAGAVDALLARAGMALGVDDAGDWTTDADLEVDASRLVERAEEAAGDPPAIVVTGGPALELRHVTEFEPVLPRGDGWVPLREALLEWSISESAARRACLLDGGFDALVGATSDPARAETLNRHAFRAFRAPQGGWVPVGGVGPGGELLPPRLSVDTDRPRAVAPEHPADGGFTRAPEAETAFELDLEHGIVVVKDPPYRLQPTAPGPAPTLQQHELAGDARLRLTVAVPADKPPFTLTPDGEASAAPLHVYAPHLVAVYDGDAMLNRDALESAARQLAATPAAVARRKLLLAGVGPELAAGPVRRVRISADQRGLLTRVRIAPMPSTPAPRPASAPQRAGDPILPRPSGLHQPVNAFRAGPLVIDGEPEGETVLAAAATHRDHRTGRLELSDLGPLAFPYFLSSADPARFGRWFFVAGVEATDAGRVRVLGPDQRHDTLDAPGLNAVRRERPEGLRGLLVSVDGTPTFVDAGPLVSDESGRASDLVTGVDGSRLSDRKRGGLQYLTVLAFSPAHGAWAPVLNLRDARTGNQAASGRGLFAERGGRSLGRLAASGNGGPVLADAEACHKHLYGVASEDGLWRECAGHISTEAFFKVPGDAEHDAPLTFYRLPFAGGVPPWTPFEAQIRYDGGSVHTWNDQLRQGRWKIQYRLPFLPDIPPTWTPPIDPPTPPQDPPDDPPPHVPAMLVVPRDIRPIITLHEVWAPSHDWIPGPSDRREREIPFTGPSLKSEGFAAEPNGTPDSSVAGGAMLLPPGRAMPDAAQDSGERRYSLLLHPEVMLAFGSPDFGTGLPSGWTLQQTAAGDLQFTPTDALKQLAIAALACVRGLKLSAEESNPGDAETLWSHDGALRFGTRLVSTAHVAAPAAPASPAHDFDGWNGAGVATLVGGATITGIAGGEAGRLIEVWGNSAGVRLNHQDSGSAELSRIVLSGGEDVVLGADDFVALRYINDRWRQVYGA